MKKSNLNFILVFLLLFGSTTIAFTQEVPSTFNTEGLGYFDKELGGIIYYIFKPSDNGYKKGETHGLVAAEYDLSSEPMQWDDAMEKCAAIGRGFHLPTRWELDMLYKAKYLVGHFSDGSYWSSTETDKFNAWYQSFSSGLQINLHKDLRFYVRAVKVF